MKSPRELAGKMTEQRRVAGGFIRETWRARPSQARIQAKQVFQDYPSSAYLTRIIAWRVSTAGEMVEWTVSRLDRPVDDSSD